MGCNGYRNPAIDLQAGSRETGVADIIEAWLHKWEEAFAICEIRADMTKIRKATHMFAEAADRWWIKEQCDKVAATTWEEFKIEFNKHFRPPDEASRAWDQYRNLR